MMDFYRYIVDSDPPQPKTSGLSSRKIDSSDVIYIDVDPDVSDPPKPKISTGLSQRKSSSKLPSVPSITIFNYPSLDLLPRTDQAISNKTSKSNTLLQPITFPQQTQQPIQETNQNGIGENKEDHTKDDSSCVICWDSIPEAVIVDCGHLCVCMECTKGLNKCPICRKDIILVIKVFKV